jgi:uncharacterized membrane protein YphA (DoxX/SURF4 family)
MTGVMKITFSQFGNAFSIQLVEAAIPFPQVMFWMIPILEIGIGLLLLFNYKTVFALFAIIPIMLVAVYVHIIVANPEAFPAQPQLPIIPIVILVMVVYLLVNESLNSSSLD